MGGQGFSVVLKNHLKAAGRFILPDSVYVETAAVGPAQAHQDPGEGGFPAPRIPRKPHDFPFADFDGKIVQNGFLMITLADIFSENKFLHQVCAPL
ncbi:hypothetical protein SDC9_209867 [bioreactor metagenome]|uniref:Uncharacterized protein n=1 Tax=bioreactor metagenome TaxID=1076179 RepID=A0A645JG82_9ZZZZ